MNIYDILYTVEYFLCASGSVVEYRLAKARVAGSNPVSRSYFLPGYVFISGFFHFQSPLNYDKINKSILDFNK